MEAADNLRTSQKQLDMDGTMVGVSRQALEEVLESHADLLKALQGAQSFIVVMFACDGDGNVPDKVPCPLGPLVNLGGITSDIRAALSKAGV